MWGQQERKWCLGSRTGLHCQVWCQSRAHPSSFEVSRRDFSLTHRPKNTEEKPSRALFCSASGSRQVNAPDANAQANAASEEEVAVFSASEKENKAVLNPSLLAEKTGIESVGDQVQDSRASVDAGR